MGRLTVPHTQPQNRKSVFRGIPGNCNIGIPACIVVKRSQAVVLSRWYCYLYLDPAKCFDIVSSRYTGDIFSLHREHKSTVRLRQCMWPRGFLGLGARPE